MALTKNIDNFCPYVKETHAIINACVSCPKSHVLLLNTLSYLENCGARKIAACEHPTKVLREMLKHAAEEFRHAYLLKSQINKISDDLPKDYGKETLLARWQTIHYLPKLETGICRFLKKSGRVSIKELKEAAYILVTYAIELRASILYPIYQNVLNIHGINISVRGLIAEEDQHLAEMESELAKIADNQQLKTYACILESSLFHSWLRISKSHFN